MNWQQWMQSWGLPVPRSPDIERIVLAAVIVIGAYWIGWLLGGRLGPRIGALARHWTGRSEDYGTRLAGALTHYGVGYDSDLALAQKLMIEAAMASPRILPEPKPTVWLTDFGDSSVDHEILCWILDPEAGVGNVRSDILNRLWLSFKEHKIELPFPQRVVRLRQPASAEA